MQETTISLGQTLLQGVWNLFSIQVPGFHFTIGQLWIGVTLCSVSLMILHMLFGIGGGSGSAPRTGSTDHPKISENRKRDEL